MAWRAEHAPEPYVPVHKSYVLPPLREPHYAPGFGFWLSGLVDGEGYFLAHRSAKSVNLAFGIKLRADDRGALETIRTVLGVGSIYNLRGRGGNTNPTCEYIVRRRDDLYGVILPQFDTFRLQTKKAVHYAIWRKIVVAAAGYRRGKGRTMLGVIGAELTPLLEELDASRNFDLRSGAARAIAALTYWTCDTTDEEVATRYDPGMGWHRFQGSRDGRTLMLRRPDGDPRKEFEDR